MSRGAEWITSRAHRDDPRSLPVLARLFALDEPAARATLRIAPLGVLRVAIDGRPVTRDVLEPGYADWRRSAEWLEYDVTALATAGEHVLRIDLGGGMIRSRRDDGRWTKVGTDLSELAVAAELELVHADGSREHVRTGQGWRSTTGAVLLSGWTGGETVDARREPDARPAGVARWAEAVAARVPPGLRLIRKTTPPIRVQEVRTAVSVVRDDARDAWVADLGANAAGWPVVDLPAGARVRLRPAELLLDDGGVDVRTEGWGPVHHDVTTGPEPLTWRPAFMYDGMRYLEITGLAEAPAPEAVRFEVLSADAPPTGSMRTSDERVDAIDALVRTAVRSNMFSVFTDCPQREKLGYLEQAHALHDLLVRSYDCGSILDRTLELAIDAQRPDGSLPLYVPEWEEFPDPWRGDPNWGGAVVLLPLHRHRQTGDAGAVLSALDAMDRYLGFLLADRDADGLLQHGLGDFNGASVKAFRDVSYVSTATLHKLLLRAADAADLVGDARATGWRTEAEVVARDFARAFIGADGRFTPGTLTADLVALDAGLAPATLLDAVEARIVADGYVIDVGAVALALLVEHLAAGGRHGTLWGITRVTDVPSYGYMLAHGATALTETWDGPTFGFSQNHFMFGAIATWFHEHLVGIRQAPGSVGWSEVLIAPTPVGDLTAVEGRYDAPTGVIESRWRIEDGRFVLSGTVPDGVTATAVLPSGARTRVAGEFELSEESPC